MDDKYPYAGANMTDAHNHLRPVLKKILSDIMRKSESKGGSLKVLDVGCGNGEFCAFLSSMGFWVTGVDSSKDGIKIAQKNFPQVSFLEKSIYELDETDIEDKFDIITSVEVIEHLAVPGKLLTKAKRFLKPDGHIILTTPYHGYLKNMALSLVNKWDDHFAVDWFCGHLRFFSVKTLTKMMKRNGFENIRFYFTGRFHPLSKSMICVGFSNNRIKYNV